MTITAIVASYGDLEWARLAGARAIPSLEGQGADEVVVVHEPDQTLAGARNIAASNAHGDWLCFLDADDELAPGYLAAMRGVAHALARIGDPVPPALLVPAVSYVFEGGEPSPPEIPAWRAHLLDVNCAVVGTLVPRLLFQNAGWFHGEPIYEDWALWLRCVRQGAVLVPVPDAVYRAHVSPSSRNHQAGGEAAETYRRVRALHSGARDAIGACKVAA